MECQMSIRAFEICMLSWNAHCPSEHSKSECSGGMPNAHPSNLNVPVECPMPIWAFEIWMLRWNAQCPSKHLNRKIKKYCPFAWKNNGLWKIFSGFRAVDHRWTDDGYTNGRTDRKNNVALAHLYHEGKWCSKFGSIPPGGLGENSVSDR